VVARLGRADDLAQREDPPPDRGVEDEPVSDLDPRAAGEAGAVQELGALVEPALGERPARVPYRLEPERGRYARAPTLAG
jgi:hypothetical protein